MAEPTETEIESNPDLHAEQWVAVLGVSSFLHGGKVAITRSAEARVQGLTAKLRREIRAFLRSRTLPPEEPPPFSWERVSSAIYTPLDVAEFERRLEGFPTAVTLSVATAAARATSTLRQLAPPAAAKTFAGDPRPQKPPVRRLEQFRWIYRVIDDTEQFTRELRENTLTLVQVQAWSQAFPTLWDHVGELVFEELASANMDRDFALSNAKNKQLQILTRVREMAPGAATAVQAALSPKPDEGGGGGQKVDLASGARTASQSVDQLG